MHRLGVAVDDDERHVLARELVRDDHADSTAAADDEVVFEFVDHMAAVALLGAGVQAAVDDLGGDQCEGVEGRPDAADEEERGEHLPGAGQVVHFAVARGRDADHRHVERVPRAPPLDQHVAGRTDSEHEGQQRDGEAELACPQLLLVVGHRA